MTTCMYWTSDGVRHEVPDHSFSAAGPFKPRTPYLFVRMLASANKLTAFWREASLPTLWAVGAERNNLLGFSLFRFAQTRSACPLLPQ